MKNKIISILSIALFFSIIVFGIIALNARFEYLNKQKSADSISYHESTQLAR